MWILIILIIGLIALYVTSNLAIGGILSTARVKKENLVVTRLVEKLGATNIKQFEKGNDLFYTFKTADGQLRLVKVDYLNEQKTKFRLTEVEK